MAETSIKYPIRLLCDIFNPETPAISVYLACSSMIICRLWSRRRFTSSSSAQYIGAINPPSRASKGRSAAKARHRVSVKSSRLFSDFRQFSIAEGMPSSECRASFISGICFNVSRIAARSRGPPRPKDSRAKARSISGHSASRSRIVARIMGFLMKNSILSSRLLIAATSVNGKERYRDNSRAPEPVTVLSMLENKVGPFSSHREWNNSKLRRVAVSISINRPEVKCFSGFSLGVCPFCVNSM